MVFSQRDEEAVILANAPATGRFLDLGAYDFLTFSNTRALADRGWPGVLVEPSPQAFSNLIHNAGHQNLIRINAAATADRSGLIEFFATPHAYATHDRKHMEKWGKHLFSSIHVACIPVFAIISQFGPFDFINIDTESSSFDLLKAIDLQAAGCQLVCVEKDDNRDAIALYLASKGFAVIHETAENLIGKRA